MATMQLCRCPQCGQDIEFDPAWTGSVYNCACGQDFPLVPRITIALPAPKIDPHNPFESAQLGYQFTERAKAAPTPRAPGQPNMGAAWGWTWRILLCLIIAGLLLSLIGGCFAAISHG